MARWEPNAVGRLQEAALELYRDPGYDKVTVAQLAARAGLTRRTFFRYFTDKREVLFFGAEKVEALVRDGIRAAPEGLSPLELVASSLAAIARISDENHDHAAYVRARHAAIQANAELRERDLAKHASLASVIAEALRGRGISEPAATLAAEAGLLGFRIGFDRWVTDAKRKKMQAHVSEAMACLGSVVKPTPRRTPARPRRA